jgi:hypothetical protein
MHPRLLPLVFPALLCAGVAAAQGLPTTQPTQLMIIREQVKLGRQAEHARIEAGWPAAFAKAKSPVHYLAMTTLTGANEAWFLVPYASNAAIGEDMRAQEADTVLAAELQRLSRADAEVLTGARTIMTVARPDLSHGPFPDLNRQRFWEITVFRVRPGHGDAFEAAAKAYGAAAERTAPNTSYRVYQVSAGMPSPTFLVFSSVESFAQFDTMAATGQRIFQSFTPDEMAAMNRFLSEGLITDESNRYRLEPQMSYVSAETRATDRAFWEPRRAARRP